MGNPLPALGKGTPTLWGAPLRSSHPDIMTPSDDGLPEPIQDDISPQKTHEQE